MLLQGKTAVDFGAASRRGIGLATAKLFAEPRRPGGHPRSRRRSGAWRRPPSLGPGHIGIGCDVADRTHAARLRGGSSRSSAGSTS